MFAAFRVSISAKKRGPCNEAQTPSQNSPIQALSQLWTITFWRIAGKMAGCLRPCKGFGEKTKMKLTIRLNFPEKTEQSLKQPLLTLLRDVDMAILDALLRNSKELYRNRIIIPQKALCCVKNNPILLTKTHSKKLNGWKADFLVKSFNLEEKK